MRADRDRNHHAFRTEIMSSGLDAGCADCVPLEHYLDLADAASNRMANLTAAIATPNTKEEDQ